MRRHILSMLAIAAGMSFAVVYVRGESTEPDVSSLLAGQRARLFEEAQAAYDDQRPAEAAARYEEIAASGSIAPALFFNLGNAYFKSGKLGSAILAYKRALYLSPRDPDAKANLAFALQVANIPETNRPLAARLLGYLAQAEWGRLAMFGYWCGAIALMVGLLVPRWRSPAYRVAGGLAAVVIVALTGVLYWRALHKQAEVVVLTPDQEALFAPLAGSTAHFAAPEGSIFRIEDTADGWLRVKHGERSGWIRADACAKVYPWSQHRTDS